MNTNIIDIEQRNLAIQPEHSFIVQAPAGSGKTELLIQRYLALLARVEQPEEIIAITFTRKAAAEMQGRILKALSLAADDVKPEHEHTRKTWMLARAALQQDKTHRWLILENPSRLKVQTIDSLCGSLIRQMPLLSQLGAHSEVTDRAEQLYQLAALRVLERVHRNDAGSEAIRDVLRHLDNDVARAQRLLVQMLYQRDQWLRQIIGKPERQRLEAGFKRLLQHYLRQCHHMFPRESIQELCELMRYAAKNLLDADSQSDITHGIEMSELPGFNVNDREEWLGIAELLLRADGQWRAAHNKNQGLLAAEGNAEEKAFRKSMKQLAKSLITRLQEQTGLHSALHIIRLLPAAEYSDNEWKMVQSLCEVLIQAAAELQVIFTETGSMDFTSVSSAAIHALGTEDEPSDLALHLDYQINHILVDEFQDISHSQYLLLKGLTMAWDMSSQKSLFLVGDPMQSIYRFREAEVRLFIDAWQSQRLANVPLQCLQLKVNFRSTSGLVDWVNEQFTGIMPAHSEPESSAVAYSSSVAIQDEHYPQAVTVFPQFAADGVLEAEQLSEEIHTIQTQYPEDTIAVLARGRTHLLMLMKTLRDKKIPYQAIEIEGLIQQQYIQDLISLTRAYCHRADKSAWMAVLRAPWCGLELQSFLHLFAEDKQRTAWQCLQDEELLALLSGSQRTRLQKVIDIFNKTMTQGKRYSLRFAIESIWLQLGGPASLNNVSELENCLEFFACIDDIDEAGDLSDSRTLFNEIDKLYAAPDSGADGRLQIMTMHKSKGLEFDHVFLPGLGRQARNQDNALLLWDLRLDGTHEDLIIAPIHETGNKDTIVYEFLKSQEKEKKKHEDSRLLYVACTRAKHCLYLSGHATVKHSDDGEISIKADSRSLLSRLWPVVEADFQRAYQPNKNDAADGKSMDFNQALNRYTEDWILPTYLQPQIQQAVDASADTVDMDIDFEWASERIMHIGTVVHQNLQWISEEGASRWNCERIQANQGHYWQQLQALGVDADDKEYCCAQVINALCNTLTDTQGQWILSNAHTDIHNEFSLSGLYDKQLHHIRIDRTFVDEEDTRWIIDYKTSRHDEADKDVFLSRQVERYQPQLDKYRYLFSGFEKREIRCALYFPLLKAFEEVKV